MQQVEEYRIGRHVISLVFRDGIAPASPYSLFLANHISAMPGQTAIDIGTGCGILGIVARLHGAARVYIVDTYDTAIEVALENARRNAVQDGFIHVPIGPNMIPLPQGETVDLVISNPAQLPLRRTDRANSPF